MRSVVIHNDVRPNEGIDWHYVNPIAYALASDLGCITPSVQSVQFYINGTYQGPYVLTEHISPDFFTARFGHTQFTVAEMKIDDKSTGAVEIGDKRLFKDLVNWARHSPAPMTLADADAKIDVRNFTNWIISIVYAGVTDPFQGVALIDNTDEDARWFWVNWDMDHAFSDRYGQVKSDWMIDSFEGRSGVLLSNEFRSIILRRLTSESTEYRQFFITSMTTALNHVLTPENAARHIEFYRQQAIDHRIEDLSKFDKIEEFTTRRPNAIREHLDKYFDAGKSYRLEIHNPNRIPLFIDGYPIDENYVGWYFCSTPARIELKDLSGKLCTIGLPE